ncbi:hypothetical protein [Streptomyces sp. L2]|uniref:hypothetical protein n=1 Tax=Streptomyces sp. L2 TaxID=2162665 RepID=UPI001012340C|nr:hypothetical protein [Streptomyces sp. L2]
MEIRIMGPGSGEFWTLSHRYAVLAYGSLVGDREGWRLSWFTSQGLRDEFIGCGADEQAKALELAREYLPED